MRRIIRRWQKAALWEMVRQVGSARFEIVSGAKAEKITDELSVDVAYADGMDQTLMEPCLILTNV